MTTEQEALRVADDLQSAVQIYPQMSEDEPGGYCRQEDQLMDEAAAMLRKLVAEREADRAAMRGALERVEHLMGYPGSDASTVNLHATKAYNYLRQRLEGTT